ncbi:MAG: hypothetical protein J2O48_00170 [Solirubrobacterales bacterium]|nr:hypothetical protein [Solirubrobacterales bacterium]
MNPAQEFSVSHLIQPLLGVLGVLALIGVLMLVRKWRTRALAATVVALACVPFVVSAALSSSRQLKQARASSTSARAGATACLAEDHAARLAPFLNWARPQLGDDVYAEIPPPKSLPLDVWCVTTALLPALPQGPGGVNAKWTITMGVVPADIRARIRRHDPSVKVFAPGLVLARN